MGRVRVRVMGRVRVRVRGMQGFRMLVEVKFRVTKAERRLVVT